MSSTTPTVSSTKRIKHFMALVSLCLLSWILFSNWVAFVSTTIAQTEDAMYFVALLERLPDFQHYAQSWLVLFPALFGTFGFFIPIIYHYIDERFTYYQQYSSRIALRQSLLIFGMLHSFALLLFPVVLLFNVFLFSTQALIANSILQAFSLSAFAGFLIMGHRVFYKKPLHIFACAIWISSSISIIWLFLATVQLMYS